MDREKMLDLALEKMEQEIESIEGDEANSHSMEECKDPLNCPQHMAEMGEGLSKEPAAVKIEVHKLAGMPSLEGEMKGEKAEEGLSPDEAEELRKLLK